MSKEKNDEESAGGIGLGFLSHLIELRDRLLRVVLIVVLVFAALFPFSNEIYTYLSGPLTQHLPEGSSMIAIDVASPFLTPFKMVLMLSVIIAVPVILYQLWSFVAPGLYKHEKRLAKPLLISSVVLFYVGMAFAYFVVFPLVFGFFTSVVPDGVAVMTDINRYLDFIITLFFAFGIAFEVPIATIILVATGVTTPQKLGRMRPFVVVGAFIIGMFLTPPDVISQVLLAVPIWLLFEVGLIVSKILITDYRKKKEDEENNIAGGATAAASTAGIKTEPYPWEVDPPPYEPKPFEDAMVSIEPEVAPEPERDDSHITDEPYKDDPMNMDRYKPMSDEEMDAELDAIDDDDEYDDEEFDKKDDKDDSSNEPDSSDKTDK